jgi:hypothetical protein
MTLYRLYLRSRVRRELLAPQRTRRKAESAVPPAAARIEHPTMICGDHRYSYAIAGSEAFEAENDAAALAIARSIFEGAADLCDIFDLWDGARQIDQSRMVTLETGLAADYRQEHVIRAEEALLSSGWAIARSRRLLARFNELRQRSTSDDPGPPAASQY